jgi:hypothetical protein
MYLKLSLHCKYVSRPWALHHHNVVYRLARGTPAIAGTITEDKKNPGTSGQLHSDLVVTNVSAAPSLSLAKQSPLRTNSKLSSSPELERSKNTKF